MKTGILFMFLFLARTNWSQELVIEPVTVKEDSTIVHRFVDEPAEFPGGDQAMKTYLETKLVRPEAVVNGKIGGLSYAQFTIEKDGTITDLKIFRGLTDCLECDAEALRVVQSMPKWKPAKINGKVVRSFFPLPIAFKP